MDKTIISNNFARVELVLQKYFHRFDLQAVRVVCAGLAAHRLSGPPVWVMHVGAPSSAKTVPIEACKGLPGFWLIDDLTPNALLSGQMEEPNKKSTVPASLLHRMGGNAIMGLGDFSTILSLHKPDRAKVLAALRRVYDGQYHREMGHADNLQMREWSGRLTITTAVTPMIDEYTAVIGALGERFILVRSPRADGIESGITAIKQNRDEVRDAMRDAVHGLFNGLPDLDPAISDEHVMAIAAMAEFAARGRSHVPRQSAGAREMRGCTPEPESCPRLAQQLAALARGSALLDGRAEVNATDMRLVKRVALDCLPPVRRKIIDGLLLFQETGLSRSAERFGREDLAAMGLLRCRDRYWEFTDYAMDLLVKTGLF